MTEVILITLLVVALFYLFFIRPTRSEERRRQRDLNELRVGDTVLTRGGLIAEVEGVETIYELFGFDPGLIHSDTGTRTGELHTVIAARSGVAGDIIPPEGTRHPPKLDASRIDAIRSDTMQVASVLGAIFANDDENDEPVDDAPDTALRGLDPKHGELVLDLIGREHWTDDAFGELCARHGLMSSGALETVNEWSFGRYDEALLDEYDGYYVSRDIASSLRN